MPDFSAAFNIYLIPPLLYLLCGFALAGLALLRRPLARENLVFAVLCFWYSLLAPIFIAHQLTADRQLILKIERGIHFFYVYLPAIQVLFFHTFLQLRRPRLTVGCFVLSFLISLTTQTPAYFNGLYQYSWGFMAKGGWAFEAFCLYGMGAIAYSLVLIFTALRRQKNPILKRKQGYMLFAFTLAALLMTFNIPAVRGVDFYPMGNFGFIPLAILGYGVIRHRLLDIRTMAHRTLLWLLVSALVLIPNVVFLFWIRNQIARIDGLLLVFLFTIWFVFNYIHIIRVQRVINRHFNKSRQALRLAASRLIDGIVHLKGLDELIREASWQISNALEGRRVEFFLRRKETGLFASHDGKAVDIEVELQATLCRGEKVYDRHLVEAHPALRHCRRRLLDLMDRLGCPWLVPLVGNDRLVGFYTLESFVSEKRLTADQIRFVEKTSGALAIALANAVMFEHLKELKNKLEAKTSALSQEIQERKRRQRQVQKVKAELEQANRSLEKAVLQANEMTARAEKTNYVLQLEIRERQKAEEALRQSEEKYRLIAENTTDVIWAADLDLNPTYISPSIKQLRGLTVEQAMAEPMEKALTKQSLEKATSMLVMELENERRIPGYRAAPRTIELEMYHRDGFTIWAEMTCSLIRDSQGRPTGLLGVIRDISERKKAEQELRFAAFNDILTGLYNRAAFMKQLGQDIEYAKRYKTRLALLFIDLDKFKQVNDTYGHEIGDRLLQDVAGRIKDSVRKTDFVARLGGDEFTVILNSPKQIMPQMVAERIGDNIRKPYCYGNIFIDFVGASIGVSLYPQDGQDVEKLLKKADANMYVAKRRRNYDWSEAASG